MFLSDLGKKVIELPYHCWHIMLFTNKILISLITPPFYMREWMQNFFNIGYKSLPVICMTAMFTGGVLALQTFSGFARFNAANSVAAVVIISVTRELGPVIGGLMVAGRVGSAIAAEISSMRISEQIEALQTMSVNKYRYLFVPKVAAGVITMPLLVMTANIIGFYGGYLVSVNKLSFNKLKYISSSIKFLEFQDVLMGMVKASVFGFIITTVGCYCGYHCEKGAKGIGNATTKALVYSSILILMSNYIITELFLK